MGCSSWVFLPTCLFMACIRRRCASRCVKTVLHSEPRLHCSSAWRQRKAQIPDTKHVTLKAVRGTRQLQPKRDAGTQSETDRTGAPRCFFRQYSSCTQRGTCILSATQGGTHSAPGRSRRTSPPLCTHTQPLPRPTFCPLAVPRHHRAPSIVITCCCCCCSHTSPSLRSPLHPPPHTHTKSPPRCCRHHHHRHHPRSHAADVAPKDARAHKVGRDEQLVAQAELRKRLVRAPHKARLAPEDGADARQVHHSLVAAHIGERALVTSCESRTAPGAVGGEGQWGGGRARL